ncbi:hypothetical protein D3C72_732480 [compost metagenome]
MRRGLGRDGGSRRLGGRRGVGGGLGRGVRGGRRRLGLHGQANLGALGHGGRLGRFQLGGLAVARVGHLGRRRGLGGGLGGGVDRLVVDRLHRDDVAARELGAVQQVHLVAVFFEAEQVGLGVLVGQGGLARGVRDAEQLLVHALDLHAGDALAAVGVHHADDRRGGNHEGGRIGALGVRVARVQVGQAAHQHQDGGADARGGGAEALAQLAGAALDGDEVDHAGGQHVVADVLADFAELLEQGLHLDRLHGEQGLQVQELEDQIIFMVVHHRRARRQQGRDDRRVGDALGLLVHAERAGAREHHLGLLLDEQRPHQVLGGRGLGGTHHGAFGAGIVTRHEIRFPLIRHLTAIP